MLVFGIFLLQKLGNKLFFLFSVIISSIFVLRSIFCGQEKEWCVKGVKEGPEAVARIRKILEAVATTLIGKDCTGGGAGG